VNSWEGSLQKRFHSAFNPERLPRVSVGGFPTDRKLGKLVLTFEAKKAVLLSQHGFDHHHHE
jgi:hypothetical protein